MLQDFKRVTHIDLGEWMAEGLAKFGRSIFDMEPLKKDRDSSIMEEVRYAEASERDESKSLCK